MTVNELHALLGKAIAAKRGDDPVQIMHVSGGVTFAIDVNLAHVATRHDGRRFWLHTGDAFAPEWAGGVKVGTHG